MSDKKNKRRQLITDGLKVKHDCFAYDKTRHSCKALEYLVCRTENCPFYKTEFERCKECKETRVSITCHECWKKGLK